MRLPPLTASVAALAIAGCAASDGNPCERAAEMAAECQGGEQLAPELECRGSECEQAEQLLAGGCEAVAAGKADGMFCWPWLRWLGLCEFDDALASGPEVAPFADEMAAIALALPGVDADGHFEGVDSQGELCTVDINYVPADADSATLLMFEAIRASEQDLEGTVENWPFPEFRFDLIAEDSVHLMEYQLVPGGVKARVKQEIPFARKDPHSSIDMTSTSSKTVFVLTDHVNDRTLRCTGG